MRTSPPEILLPRRWTILFSATLTCLLVTLVESEPAYHSKILLFRCSAAPANACSNWCTNNIQTALLYTRVQYVVRNIRLRTTRSARHPIFGTYISHRACSFDRSPSTDPIATTHVPTRITRGQDRERTRAPPPPPPKHQPRNPLMTVELRRRRRTPARAATPSAERASHRGHRTTSRRFLGLVDGWSGSPFLIIAANSV